MNDHEISEQFNKGVSKVSLAMSVYFEEYKVNKKFTKTMAMTKVEQIILDNYMKRQNKN
jgi:hypothetical protein